MFGIKCYGCGNEAEITYFKHDHDAISMEVFGDMFLTSGDGCIIIECEKCGRKLDFYNDEIKA